MSVQTSVSGPSGARPASVESRLRRNFTVLASDMGLFGLGMTFISVSTILPAFAQHLGASNVVIGAIPAIMALGYALPPLFAANHVERLHHKVRFVLTYTVWERLPLLALAGTAYFLAESQPGLVLALLLVFLALITGIGGVLTPAWMDLIGKVVPTNYRGRLFAVGSTLTTGLGLAGAVLIGYYLDNYPFPLSYALAFATGFVFLMLSFIFLALVVETPVASSKPRVGLGTYLRRLPEVLDRDRNFTWYLISRAAGAFATMAFGFYTVYALAAFQAPEWEVARFTFVLMAGQTVANLLFGYAADHLGHKLVLIAGTLAVIVGNAIAMASQGIEWVYVVFLCMAIFLSATGVSALNLAMEFAPAADRPTYVGLASTLIAPLAFLAPLLGGVVADSAGYHIVFALAGLTAALSLWILAARVRDPRSQPQATDRAHSPVEGVTGPVDSSPRHPASDVATPPASHGERPCWPGGCEGGQ